MREPLSEKELCICMGGVQPAQLAAADGRSSHPELLYNLQWELWDASLPQRFMCSIHSHASVQRLLQVHLWVITQRLAYDPARRRGNGGTSRTACIASLQQYCYWWARWITC